MTSGFSVVPAGAKARHHSISRPFLLSSTTRCCAKKQSKNNNADLHQPANEFSRTLRPDRILRTTGQQQQRSYHVSVKADPGECESLAHRFDLSQIRRLSADLALRPEFMGYTSLNHKRSSCGMEVEGTCRATVTQRCVRTNEDFQVDLEFPLYCIVRPVTPLLVSSEQQLTASYDGDDDDYDEYRRGSSTETARRGKTTTASYRPQDRNLDEMDVMEMQNMLQADLSAEEDVLMEDESIYTTDGLLDIGELVAQLFWLELDPYPKRPGTDPVQRSITG